MSVAERARRDRLNTWTCEGGCGTSGMSEGSPPMDWWTLSRRGSFGARHFCGLVCLLGFLVRQWQAVLRGEAVG